MATTRRQTQKEDTRRLILTAAFALFAERGYEKTTLRGVAARAGVGLGTIFKHFPDKSALLVAAFAEDLEAVAQRALDSLPPRGLVRQLGALTSGIYGFYAGNPHFSRALLSQALFATGETRDVLDTQLEAFLGKVAELIARAVADGELPQGTDVGLGVQAYAAFYLAGLVTGLGEENFDVAARALMVVALCENYFLASSSPVTASPKEEQP